MKSKNPVSIPAPVDVEEFDFGFDVAEDQSWMTRGHGGGGSRAIRPLFDPAKVGVKEWVADWVGTRAGDAHACKEALRDGTEWPESAAKYAARGVFVGRFGKPSSAVARGRSNGEGPILVQTKEGNLKIVGYWTFRRPGGEDVPVVTETEEKSGKTVEREVRAVKADRYTVGVRLALAQGEVYGEAEVADGEFVTPASIKKESVVKV
jgi:hypothetical protein